MDPTVTWLRYDGAHTFRLEGGALAPPWAESLKPGETAWCRVIWYPDGDLLAAYGGSVWPSAWPAYFRGEGSTVRLTEKGLSALREAAASAMSDIRGG
jgi:hypothetical protein